MAIVPNKGMSTPVDKKYATPNRTNAGAPVGSLTPLYPNELVFDSTNTRYYKGIGRTNNDWQYVVLTQRF